MSDGWFLKLIWGRKTSPPWANIINQHFQREMLGLLFDYRHKHVK